MRRYTIVAVVSFAVGAPIIQIGLLLAIQILVVMYLLIAMPFKQWQANWIEVCNEVAIFLVYLLGFIFTNKQLGAVAKVDVGYIALGVILMALIFNVLAGMVHFFDQSYNLFERVVCKASKEDNETGVLSPKPVHVVKPAKMKLTSIVEEAEDEEDS